MAIQLGVTARNNLLDSLETTVGTAPTMEIRSGSAPANCAASATGSVLATITLPSDWMAAASSGSKAMAGTWQDTSADATGTAGYFRIIKSGTCHMQGTVGTTGTDMIVDNASFNAGQQFTVTEFTLTAPGA